MADRGPDVVVHQTPELLAAAAAARLIVRLVDAQAARGTASFVATGGGMGSAVLAAVADSPARDAVDCFSSCSPNPCCSQRSVAQPVSPSPGGPDAPCRA